MEALDRYFIGGEHRQKVVNFLTFCHSGGEWVRI